jgi:GT2 family glycosyltransferase
MRLAVAILNYRTPALTAAALASLAGEIDGGRDRAIVVDNGSGDDSVDRLRAVIAARGWASWAEVRPLAANGGFAHGMNQVLGRVDAEAYLLLNSDARLRPGAVAALLAALGSRPDAGVLGPCLVWPDDTPQVSCFRFPSLLSELERAAATGPVSRLLRRYEIVRGRGAVGDPDWVSFACVLIRRETRARVGLLDEGYFMYSEDVDYCRRARGAGWRVAYVPAARAVHLRAGGAPWAPRRPPYWFASRARYFAKFHGRRGLLAANLCWTAGCLVARAREALRGVRDRAPRESCRAIWRHSRRLLARRDRA